MLFDDKKHFFLGRRMYPNHVLVKIVFFLYMHLNGQYKHSGSRQKYQEKSVSILNYEGMSLSEHVMNSMVT